ncbi:MAG: hypothetical protein FJ272_20420, partial [Planctomycetes bacterium]|nr:hypothetical protein [Planctomycetota bacterium]
LAGLLADEPLSHIARYALESMPDPSVDDALRTALGQLKGKPLIGVINSVGERRDDKAVDALATLLRSPDGAVASAAAAALGKIGTPAAARALEKALDSAPAANQPSLGDAGLCCADALASQGRRAEALALYDRLRSPQKPLAVRTAAMRGAIRIRGIPALVEHLHSADPSMVNVALWLAQHELPGAEATQALAAELAKLPVERQAQLIQALRNRGESEALPALRTLAKSGERPIRLAALQALGPVGRAAAIPTLLETLTDPDAELAKAAQAALGSLPGPEADAATVTMIESADKSRRLVGIELAVARRLKSASPSLLSAARGPDEQVRLAALKGLRELAGPGEFPSLLGLLVEARTPAERDAAERALAPLCGKTDACAEKLAALMPQAQPALKPVLLRLLRATGGPQAFQAVRAALSDPDPDVRASAIRTLGEWKTAEAAPVLLELAKVSADKVPCLRSALRLAGNKDVPEAERAAICRQAAALIERDDERKLLLSTLGGIHTLESLDMAAACLSNPAVKEEACAAVVSIAEKLAQSPHAAKTAPKLLEPLRKAAQSTANPTLAER